MGSLKWGVEVTPLKSIKLPHGDVLHGIKSSESNFKGFGEAYFSCILPASVKGWKMHKEMTLNLIVPIGLIKFVVFRSDKSGNVDLSSGSLELILGREHYSRLTIPPTLWLAFQGLGDLESILLNVASHEHDPLETVNVNIHDIEYSWASELI